VRERERERDSPDSVLADSLRAKRWQTSEIRWPDLVSAVSPLVLTRVLRVIDCENSDVAAVAADAPRSICGRHGGGRRRGGGSGGGSVARERIHRSRGGLIKRRDTAPLADGVLGGRTQLRSRPHTAEPDRLLAIINRQLISVTRRPT